MATQTVPNRSGVCGACGAPYEPYQRRSASQRFCSDSCRVWAYKHPGQHRQASFPFAPWYPLPPVQDQRVPKSEQPKLCRMSRAILERLREGEALASELQAMFPGARSVRTRISNVNRWLQDRGERVKSAPVCGVVGEWRYWLEANR